MTREIIYLTRDNTFTRQFFEDGEAIDATMLTRVTIKLAAVLDSDTLGGIGAGSRFDCTIGSGKIRFDLGDQTIAAGTYNAEVVTYDPTNTAGIAWPRFIVKVE